MDRAKLSQLQKERFPELPLDCGKSRPGVVDTEEWRDWSTHRTTPDQLRIEDYLERVGVEGKSILHIGVGNSGLAERFAKRASRVVGTTIMRSEVTKAESLGLANYRAFLHNKYSGADGEIDGQFDIIVDNNPTSFCCCMNHLGAMLDFYASALADGGEVVTDRVGLGWKIAAPDAHARWGFNFDDLAAVAPLAGLRAYRMTDFVYVLARRQPRPPSKASLAPLLARQLAHKLRQVPGRLLRRGS